MEKEKIKEFDRAMNKLNKCLLKQKLITPPSRTSNEKKTLKKKKTRDYDLIHFRDILERWEFYKNAVLLSFIGLKSYRLETDKTETRESIDYLTDFFQFAEKVTRKHVEFPPELLKLFNKRVIMDIENHKYALKNNTHLFFRDKRIPQAKMWFVDVFGKASERYLPGWEKYKRKSHNRPNFKNSYEIFKKYIKGATAKQVEYGKKYPRLRYKILPQGLIMLLFHIDRALYGVADSKKAFLTKKKDMIKEILKGVSTYDTFDVLYDLLTGYSKDFKTGYSLLSLVHSHKK